MSAHQYRKARNSLCSALFVTFLVTSGLTFSLLSAKPSSLNLVNRCWLQRYAARCLESVSSRLEQHPIGKLQKFAMPNGDERSYIISRFRDSGPSPTIVMFHGINGNALETASASGLGRAALLQGFVAVFPNASGGLWNAFPPGRAPITVVQRANQNLKDDVSFIRNLVASLVRSGISDPRRIYIAGFSMGGFMALNMVCADAEDFVGVAIISSSMPTVTGEACSPTKPLPFLLLNGTDDRSVPYNGGVLFPGKYEVWATSRILNFFRKLNGCSTDVRASELPLESLNQTTRVTLEKWADCGSQKIVEHYKINGGQHEFPIGVDTSRALTGFFGMP